MKFLGVGLSKTGTNSLHKALEELGMKGIHYDTKRLNGFLTGRHPATDFRVYDDVDVVTDIPSAHYYKELLAAYPDSKAILTIRETEDWWKSMHYHITVNHPLRRFSTKYNFRKQLRIAVYGSLEPDEKLFKQRFEAHNRSVIENIPSDRLLVMNIIEGDGWDKLCPFLGLAEPACAFPYKGRTKYQSG